MENKTLTELHEEIFQFLYQKHEEDENFMFRVRQTNHVNKLDKKYWFIGNDGYLTITFWAGNNTSKRPYIRFNILPYKGIISIDYKSKSSKNIQNLFIQLASLNGIPRKSDTEWRKIMKLNSNDYLDKLNDFITKDKKVIDNVLAESLKKQIDLDKLKFITIQEFDKWIDNINQYR